MMSKLILLVNLICVWNIFQNISVTCLPNGSLGKEAERNEKENPDAESRGIFSDILSDASNMYQRQVDNMGQYQICKSQYPSQIEGVYNCFKLLVGGLSSDDQQNYYNGHQNDGTNYPEFLSQEEKYYQQNQPGTSYPTYTDWDQGGFNSNTQGYQGQGVGYPGQGQMGMGYPGQSQMGMGYPGQGQMGMGYPGQSQMGMGYPGQGQLGMGYPGQGQLGTGYPGQGQMGMGQGMGYPDQGQGYPSYGQGQSYPGQYTGGQGQGMQDYSSLGPNPFAQSGQGSQYQGQGPYSQGQGSYYGQGSQQRPLKRLGLLDTDIPVSPEIRSSEPVITPGQPLGLMHYW